MFFPAQSSYYLMPDCMWSCREKIPLSENMLSSIKTQRLVLSARHIDEHPYWTWTLVKFINSQLACKIMLKNTMRIFSENYWDLEKAGGLFRHGLFQGQKNIV